MRLDPAGGILMIAGLLALVLSACNEENVVVQGCDACENGCEGSVCNIECIGTGVCASRTFICPEGLACELDCQGTDSCDDVVLICPPDYDCVWMCEGRDACGDTTFECDTGDCTMECGMHVDSCEGGTVNCGSGACTVTCAGSVPPRVNNCDTAASCTEC